MNSFVFNASLLLGWMLIVVGVSGLASIWAGLLAGGVLLVVVTLLLAKWAGVQASPKKQRTTNVPE